MAEKIIYFYRNYQGFSGGHLKVHDYYHHVLQSSLFSPYVYLDPESRFDQSNPWQDEDTRRLPGWHPERADTLFLGGADWLQLPEHTRNSWPKPVINLIQGIRHADPQTLLNGFLSHHAIRICVSPEVAEAICKSGRVNGPVFTIPNGVDFSVIPDRLSPENQRGVDILIAGNKNREFGRNLQDWLNQFDCSTQLLDYQIPRQDFLKHLSNSRITVFLPETREGFYLPSLEGMASETLVICPDCVGNRSHNFDGVNCLMPEYSLDSMKTSIVRALEMTQTERDTITQSALHTARKHTIEAERDAFLEILHQVEELWKA